MQLYIKTLLGDPKMIDAIDSLKIREMKESIEKISGIPVKDQKLFHYGVELTNNEDTLMQYNILQNDTIVIVQNKVNSYIVYN